MTNQKPRGGTELQLEYLHKYVDKFTLDKMTEKLGGIMDKITEQIPQQVSMSLPKLKKKGEPVTQPKVTLPKLKKLSQQEAVNG